jgi:hypothetical protein
VAGSGYHGEHGIPLPGSIAAMTPLKHMIEQPGTKTRRFDTIADRHQLVKTVTIHADRSRRA